MTMKIATCGNVRHCAAILCLALCAFACSRTPELTEQEKRSQALDHLEKGQALEGEKLYGRAIQEHLKALSLAPSPQIHYHLGHCYSRLGEFDTAAEYLRKAVEGAPDFTMAYYELQYAEERMQESLQAGGPTPGLQAGPPLEQTSSGAAIPEQKPAPMAMADGPLGPGLRPMSVATAEDFRPPALLPPPPDAVERSVREISSPPSPFAGGGLLETAAPAQLEKLPVQDAPRRALDGSVVAAAPSASAPGISPATPSRMAEALAEPSLPPAGVRVAAAPEAPGVPPTTQVGLQQARDVMFPAQTPVGAPIIPFDQAGQPTVLSDSMFHVRYGDRFAERGDHEKAREEYIEALRKDERNTLARVRLARSFDALNMPDRAEEQIRRAVEIQPNSPEAAIGLAEVFYDRRRYEEAKVWADRAIAMSPENADAIILLADINGKLGRSAYAEQLYQQAHTLAPESPKPSWKMGLLRLEVKDYAQARTLFERALQIDPKCIPALNNLGVMDHIQGDYESARKNFEGILKIDPSWSKAHFNLAVLYESPNMLDDRKKAISHYERYLALGGGDRASEARLAIAELKAQG